LIHFDSKKHPGGPFFFMETLMKKLRALRVSVVQFLPSERLPSFLGGQKLLMQFFTNLLNSTHHENERTK